jgi:hypothetical protein
LCKITKAHLKRILSDDETLAGLRTDVAPLIKASRRRGGGQAAKRGGG